MQAFCEYSVSQAVPGLEDRLVAYSETTIAQHTLAMLSPSRSAPGKYGGAFTHIWSD
jgi:hypothetical protein